LKDYKWHKLELDVSDRKDVDDESVESIGSAQVRWKTLNLKGTVVSGKGLVALAETCPSLLVKYDLSPIDGMRVEDMAYIATQVPVEE
jgi:hypothetical protein